MPGFRRARTTDEAVVVPPVVDNNAVLAEDGSERTLAVEEPGLGLTTAQIKRATRTRKIFTLLSSFFLFCSVIFMILVEIANTSNMAVLRDIYFIKLNLTNIFPISVPNGTLLNSIARTLGLHDFYQVGLWNFCEGYNNEGVTNCSKPQTLYWFNPVQILLNELLAGATSEFSNDTTTMFPFLTPQSVALPAELVNILSLIKTVSHLMFGFFLAGTCLAFVMIFISPLIVRSRWLAFVIGIFTFIAALLITAGAVIATVMFIIFKNALTSQTDVNIGATIGVTMFALMWTAAACAIFAFVIQLCLMCCCASRRDVKKGKKRGSKKAYPEGVVVNEKPKKGMFGRSKA